MNVISASRRTDIPAFYWRWFMNRLDEGFCDHANPFNTAQVKRVSLKAEDVAAIVFWTRDARPMFKDIPELHRRGYRFYVHYTLNGYARELEPRNPAAGRAVETIKALSGATGPERVTWRYDPIILGSATPPAYHIESFTSLVKCLSGAVRDVYISFCEPYAKTRRRLAKVEEETGWSFDLAEEGHRAALTAELALVAAAYGMRLNTCSQPGLDLPGVRRGRCVDPGRIQALRPGQDLNLKAAPTRPGCDCVASIDIGAYDTCAFGCQYCYATASPTLAARRVKEHDQGGSFLWPTG